MNYTKKFIVLSYSNFFKINVLKLKLAISIKISKISIKDKNEAPKHRPNKPPIAEIKSIDSILGC